MCQRKLEQTILRWQLHREPRATRAYGLDRNRVSGAIYGPIKGQEVVIWSRFICKSVRLSFLGHDIRIYACIRINTSEWLSKMHAWLLCIPFILMLLNIQNNDDCGFN